jgi:flagellin
MGIRINQNVMAMNAYRNLTSSEGSLSKSLERLSSGFRINRAADDAAGLVISEGLRSQVMGLKMATRNAQDGVSVVQTAEGALTETHSILQRMRELAVQAASTGSSDQPSRDAAQVEIVQLKSELDRIGNTTKFGAQTLLDGTYGVTQAAITGAGSAGAVTITTGTNDKFGIDVDGGASTGFTTIQATIVPTVAGGVYGATQAGAAALQKDLQSAIDTAVGSTLAAQRLVTASVKLNAAGTGLVTTFNGTQGNSIGVTTGTAQDALSTLVVTSTATAAASGSGGSFQVGSGTSASDKISITINDVRSAALGLGGVDVSVAANATTNLNSIDAAITTVSTLRGNLGAYQNRFEHTISNLSITTENLSASESRIRDTDMASEMMSFTRAQILQQAGTAMLAQANSVPQTVLQLLK